MIDRRNSLPSIRCLFLVATAGDAALESEGLQWIESLSGEGIDAEIGFLREPSAVLDRQTDLPVHPQILADKHDLSVWRRVPQLLNEGEFDAIITMGGEEETFWGRLGGLRGHLPVVISYIRSRSDINWDSALQQMLASGTDRFLCESPDVADAVAMRPEISPSRVETLAIGVDIEQYRPHPARRAAMRYELGLSVHDTVCGFVFGSEADEGVDFMLEASRWAAGQTQNWKMLLLDVPQDREQDLQQAVERKKLDKHVMLRGQRDDLPAALSLLDVYTVNPAHHNPRTEVLRAMAAGLPVAVSHKSVAADLVLNGVTGWYHDAIEEAAAEAWAECCASEQRRRQFGRVGRELVASRWSINASARGLGTMLRELYTAKRNRFLPIQATDLPAETALMKDAFVARSPSAV